ncbi:RNA polymerase sigma-70 factor [Proteiniphilum sp. X52]|uniref:RNA polymerase sigma-70 factor n=1 Tax=Proteiniphilum sp. X52 TaxID=2382159 RepID=UPI000F0A4EEC|nr:RNA polymerase sigma-70 factor [Proteiniphilum sp. X52]RNC63397.1 RNA polymerase sigma-70 factor [Proteiniphilum sp. X52]
MRKDIQHFESLFRRLQPGLFAYCCKYVEDEELARDIVQECLVQLWENYETINGSYEKYMIVAVKNRCISHFRTLRLQSKFAESVRLKIKEFEFHPDTPDPLTDIYMKEVSVLLQEYIEKLPAKCRKIFIMSRQEGLKNQEIADRLGISVRTVEAQIYHALKVIRIGLKDYLPFFCFFI